MAVFVEFFVNLYVMSLPVELVVQIMVVVPSLMVAVGDQKPEYKSAKVFCELVLAVIGLALFAFTARQIYLDWHQLDARGLLLEFALPIWLTVGLLPFLCLQYLCRLRYGVSPHQLGGKRWTVDLHGKWSCLHSTATGRGSPMGFRYPISKG